MYISHISCLLLLVYFVNSTDASHDFPGVKPRPVFTQETPVNLSISEPCFETDKLFALMNHMYLLDDLLR